MKLLKEPLLGGTVFYLTISFCSKHFLEYVVQNSLPRCGSGPGMSSVLAALCAWGSVGYSSGKDAGSLSADLSFEVRHLSSDPFSPTYKLSQASQCLRTSHSVCIKCRKPHLPLVGLLWRLNVFHVHRVLAPGKNSVSANTLLYSTILLTHSVLATGSCFALLFLSPLHFYWCSWSCCPSHLYSPFPYLCMSKSYFSFKVWLK